MGDLTEHAHRWPRFVPAALPAGFRSVHAVPMRLRSRTLGALGLFSGETDPLNDRDLSEAVVTKALPAAALPKDGEARA